MPTDLLRTLDAFYDAVPRSLGDPHDVGPLTLFVKRTGWNLYARPTLGAGTVSGRDVRALLRRADGLVVPPSIEWVHETTPTLAAAAAGAGLHVTRMPLLVLDVPVLATEVEGVDVRMLSADDPQLPAARAAVHAGFSGTDDLSPEPVGEWIALRVREGLMRAAGAFGDDGANGVTTVFLSAGDDAVARVYERVGFRRVATACTAEVPAD